MGNNRNVGKDFKTINELKEVYYLLNSGTFGIGSEVEKMRIEQAARKKFDELSPSDQKEFKEWLDLQKRIARKDFPELQS